MSAQDRCTVCTKRTIGSEIILARPLVLLHDVGQMEARIGPFGDSVNLNARSVHSLHRMYHRFGNHFGRTQ
jgi:hypothetical protein